MEKYDKDGPFQDPVVMCDSCNDVVLVAKLKEVGSCPYCGNTRMRNLRSMKQEHMDKMKEWNVDPAFIALFEGVDE